MSAQPVPFSNGGANKTVTSSVDLQFDDATNILTIGGQPVETPLSPTSTHLIYVSPNGSDTTGSGSILNPYQTIAKAQTLITNALNQNVILLMPGTYAENVSLKPSVFLLGYNPDQVTLSGDIDVNDALWSGTVGKHSGTQNLKIAGNVDIDFTTYSVSGAQFVCAGGILQGPGVITFTAFDAVQGAGIVFINTVILTNVIINGGFVVIIGIPQNFSPTMTINSSSIIGTQIFYDGAVFGTNFNINYTNGDDGMGLNFATIDSPGTITVDASTGSSPGSISLTGSVSALSNTISYLNDGAVATTVSYSEKALGLGYTPAVPGNWTVQPVNVQQALDMIAAKVGPV